MTECLVVQPIAEPGLELLRGAGLAVGTPDTTDFAALEPHLAKARAVITRNHGLSAIEIAAAPNLEVIVSHGAGTDAIDKFAAAERRIRVTSTPGANTIAVAEHTIALILACARQIPQADLAMRNNDFGFRYRQTGFEIAGKTLGLVGYGRIARGVASLARAFGMHVIAVTDHAPDADLASDSVERVDIDTLCARSDIVSLHSVPGRSRRFDAARIDALRPGAIVINTARGTLLDETALVAALRNGKLTGAALDVFSPEPPPEDSPLFNCPNLILTPHVGGSALEALDRTAIAAARKVIETLGASSQ